MDTRRHIIFNAAANHVYFLTNALVGLVVNPLLVMFLGPAAFGSWKACQRLFELAVASDGGSAQAIKWLIAHREKDAAASQRSIGAALTIWLRFLPMNLVIALAIAVAIPAMITGLDGTQSELFWQASVILAANAILLGLVNLPLAALIGSNKGYIGLLPRSGLVILTNVGVVICAMSGFGLPGMALTMLVTIILSALLCWILARRNVPNFGIRRPLRSEVRQMWTMSKGSMVLTYAQRLLLASEVILLGILVGAGAITAYVFTAYAAQFVLAALQMTTSAMMPSLTKALGSGNLADADRLAQISQRLTIVTAIAAACALLVFNPSFVLVWAGPEHYLGHDANALIVLLMLQLAIFRTQNQGDEARLRTVEAAAHMALCAVAGIGAAMLCWAIRPSVEALFLGLLLGRVVSVAIPAFWRKSFGIPPMRHLAGFALGAMLLGGSYVAGTNIVLNTWPVLIATMAICFLAFAPLVFVGVLGPSRWSIFRGIVVS